MESEYGEVLNTLPEEYVPRQQWPEYDPSAEVDPMFPTRCIRGYPVGARWGSWPMTVEEYVSDEEPHLEAYATIPRVRIIRWLRLVRADKPRGWLELKNISRLEGFTEIGSHIDYVARWSKAARQDRRKWQEQYCTTYHIENIERDEFESAYRKSTVFKKVKRRPLIILHRLLASEPSASNTMLWGVRNMETNEIIAGQAISNSPACRASYYQVGFMTPQAMRVPAMIGLIDNWHQYAQTAGMRYLHFGSFWHPGKDREVYEGFSFFKSKFGLKYIAHQPILVKILYK